MGWISDWITDQPINYSWLIKLYHIILLSLYPIMSHQLINQLICYLLQTCFEPHTSNGRHKCCLKFLTKTDEYLVSLCTLACKQVSQHVCLHQKKKKSFKRHLRKHYTISCLYYCTLWQMVILWPENNLKHNKVDITVYYNVARKHAKLLFSHVYK